MASKVTGARTKKKGHGQEADVPWWWEHRVGLTPFAASFAVALWTFVLPGYLLATTQLLIATGAIGLCLMGLAHRKYGGSNSVAARQMRAFVNVLIIYTMAGIATFRVWGELTRDWLMWGFVVWVISTLLFGSFWWTDHANLMRIKKEREVIHWPVLAERIGMPDLRKSQVFKTETGGKVRLWWMPGTLTKGRVKQGLDQIVSVMEIPEGLARLENVIDTESGEIDPNGWWLIWNDAAPGRKEAIPFTNPTARSATDEILIALREDGVEVKMRLYDNEFGGVHMLAGGMSGSGKSGLYHLLMAELADACDLVRWGMDLKGGMAFKPWAPLFDWFIDDEKDAGAMLKAARAVIEARAKYAAAKGWDPWQVGPDHPLIVICVDECAVLFGQGAYELVELGKLIAQQGRACGVELWLATQHATNEAVGSQQIMKNIGRRFAFRCSDSTQQSVLLPNGWEKVDCTAIPLGKEHAGKCYWSDGGNIDTLMMRVRFVTKQMIKDLVAEFWTTRCDLDLGTTRAAQLATENKDGTNAYDLRHIWTLEDLGPSGATDLLQPDEVLDDDQIWDQIFGTGATAPITPTRQSGTAAPVHSDDTKVSFDKDMDLGGDDDLDPALADELDAALGAEGETEDYVDYTEDHDDAAVSDLTMPMSEADGDELDAAIAAFWASRSNRVSTEEAKVRCDKALRTAGSQGMQLKDLVEVSGRARTWTWEWLAEEQMAGRVILRERGVYAYTDMHLAGAVTANTGS